MKKTRSHSKKGLIILIIITVVLCAVTVLKKQEQSEEYTENKSDYIDSVRPDIDVELLTPNEYSRAGIATNSRNIDTVSIECCHPDETGKFNQKTYQSMIDLCAWLCLKFDLNENDVIRHYDVTGKICPKYFVEHEDAWKQFKGDVGVKLEKLKEYQ